MKFCGFLASLYLHISANFGRFILIFNKMALIFLGVLIVFTVSSFGFQQVRLPLLHCQWWVAPLHLTSIHWIIRFGGNAGSYRKLQQKPKTVPEFWNALQLIWSALPEKAIDNFVKDHHKRLQACVSANGGHFEHMSI